MRVKVLGVQKVDYFSRKKNEQVRGVNLHCAFNDSNVTGEAVASVYFSENLKIPCISDVRPGMMVDVEYNNRGYACGLSVCK